VEIPTRLVTFKASGNPARINAADFDSEIHADPEEKPAAPSSVPESIAGVNGETAYSMIASADELSALDVIEADEKASEKYPGGRKGVLRAIAERRAELGR